MATTSSAGAHTHTFTGTPGATGPAGLVGPAGPVGPPGTPADPARLAALEARVAVLEGGSPPPPPPPSTKPPINVGSGGVGINVTDSGVIIQDETILGPQSGAYNGNEVGIRAVASASSPIRDLTIRRCVIKNFGYGGMYLRHVWNLILEDVLIEDGVYAGIMGLSIVGGRLTRVTVRRIGVRGAGANSNNAYGIALSHNEGPRSSDVLVDQFLVEDVPTWEALDTHGGLRITFSNGTVRRSRRGVMLTSGVGGEAAQDCKVLTNRFLEPISVPVGDQYAIVPVGSVNAVVTGNTISGWGSGRDLLPGYPNTNLVYSGNIVTP